MMLLFNATECCGFCQTSDFTFSRNGVAFPGADGDGSGFGQVSACPPNLYLDIAGALIHHILRLTEVQRRLCESWEY